MDNFSSVPTLTVVVPAKNEEGRIGRCVTEVHKVLSGEGIGHEIIVADDGSDDGTYQEAINTGLAKVVRTQEPRGKGAAIMAGMRHSMCEYVAFVDADMEYPVEALPRMLELSGPNTAVVARRDVDGRSSLERVTSKASRLVIRFLLRLNVSDTQAGLKLFPGALARGRLSTCAEMGWLYDVEALLVSAEAGCKLSEFPVAQSKSRPRRAGPLDFARSLVRLVSLAEKHGRSSGGQVARFGVVGVANTLVDLASFTVMISLLGTFATPEISGATAALSWLLASVLGYIMHTRFTFRRYMSPSGFYIFSILGLLVQVSSVALFSWLMGYSGAILGKAVGVGISAVLTFYGYRYVARRGLSGYKESSAEGSSRWR